MTTEPQATIYAELFLYEDACPHCAKRAIADTLTAYNVTHTLMTLTDHTGEPDDGTIAVTMTGLKGSVDAALRDLSQASWCQEHARVAV